jgi:hypothetical protein
MLAGMTTTKAPTATPELHIELPLRDETTRRMRGVFPDENQLAVWQSSGERFARLGEDWTRREKALSNLPEDDQRVVAFRRERGQQAGRTLGRALTMLKSALAEERDHDWLEDQLLFGQMDLGEAMQIITLLTAELGKVKQERQTVKKAAAGKAKLVV